MITKKHTKIDMLEKYLEAEELIDESYKGIEKKTFWQTYWFMMVLFFITGFSFVLAIWSLIW